MDSKRLKYCKYLAENNICVNVYGSGWNNYVNTNKNLIIENRPVFGTEYKNNFKLNMFKLYERLYRRFFQSQNN